LSVCVYTFTCFHSLSPCFEFTLYKHILFHKHLALLLGLLLHCTSCALTLFSYRPRSIFKYFSTFCFSLSACATICLEVREKREPEASVCPTSNPRSFPCKIGNSSNFLVFSCMVATSCGWCGTKIGTFWFNTQKSHLFAFRLLSNNTSINFSYRLMIIIMLNLNN